MEQAAAAVCAMLEWPAGACRLGGGQELALPFPTAMANLVLLGFLHGERLHGSLSCR